MNTVYIGYDPKEETAYQVLKFSLERISSKNIRVVPIRKNIVELMGLYRRESEMIDGQPYDVIDGRPFSTEFSFTRFLVPALMNFKGWALFCDCDFIFLSDVADLIKNVDESKAVYCVQHDYTPKEKHKMDGKIQTIYPRKNWSSCVLWNCGHPANALITPKIASNETGAFLHRFQWLPDNLIGEFPIEWNWLEGEYDKPDTPPAVIHYTNGGPWFKECQHVDYAQEWLDALAEANG